MFILITAECEVISGDTKVDTFATKQEAHDAMIRDAKIRARDAGVPDEEFDEFVDDISDNGGFILDMVGWQIREIPDFPSHKRAQTAAETVSYEDAEYCVNNERCAWETTDAITLSKEDIDEYLNGEK